MEHIQSIFIRILLLYNPSLPFPFSFLPSVSLFPFLPFSSPVLSTDLTHGPLDNLEGRVLPHPQHPGTSRFWGLKILGQKKFITFGDVLVEKHVMLQCRFQSSHANNFVIALARAYF